MSKKKLAKANQISRLQRLMGMDLVTGFSLAIDGGANIGEWSIVMAEHFDKIIAFEPIPETFALLVKNTKPFANIECHDKALMDRVGVVTMRMPVYSEKHQIATGEKLNEKLKSRYVEWSDGGTIQTTTIDSLNLASCDLIKLDLEGAEPLALDGAVETITKFRPMLIVEIKKHSKRFGVEPNAVHNKVLDMGYNESFRAGRDRFYVSDK